MVDDWRLVHGSGAAVDAGFGGSGARNMAVDHVLFESARLGGRPILRFYRWTPACLSLGRNQPARGRYDLEGRVPGCDIVRRPTGGLAVFHDQELTYSVACPVGALGSPRTTYRRVHEAIARGLASLGVPATVSATDVSTTPSPADPLGVCFAAPAEGEILAAAGKLVGSAQRTEARTILQHGSILIDGSQDRAAAPAGRSRPGADSDAGRRTPDASSQSPAKAQNPTLKALLGREPADHELIAAIREAFEAELGIRLAPGCLSADEVRRLPDAEAHYRSDDWTWRV